MDSSTVQSLPSAQDEDNSPLLLPLHIIGVLLHRAKVYNNVSIQTVLCSVATEMAINPTKETMLEETMITPYSILPMPATSVMPATCFNISL